MSPSRSCGGPARHKAPGGPSPCSIPGLAGEQHARDLAVEDDVRLDRLHIAPARVCEQLRGGGEAGKLL